MSEAWIPVLLAAVIVIGVVGGSLAQMVLKELLPLLRTLSEQRNISASADVVQLAADLEAVQAQVAELKSAQNSLAEETRFLTRLLVEKSATDVEHQETDVR